MYAGGADTTVSSLETFYLIMSLYPKIQKKAQAELDRVVEPGCLPDFNDRANLPYLSAVLHKRDLSVESYGTDRAVLHDPSLYPDPFRVNPERYLKHEGRWNPDPRRFAFSYGRRVCPGKVIAEDSIFIFVACALATLDISKAVGPDGLPIESDVQYTADAVRYGEGDGPQPDIDCLMQEPLREIDYYVAVAFTCPGLLSAT
ncbi:predicted protein [Postia placenta Mad-698-R]|nr:predicted protein [Postia placenta Mad-698-R]